MKKSGEMPFQFMHRGDLHALPEAAKEFEANLHGGFASDRRAGFGPVYYGMPDYGILRIEPDLSRQTLIGLPVNLKPMNFHSTKLGWINGQSRLFLAANNDARVAVVTLEGELDFTLSKPEFDQYRAESVPFAPTDTILVDEKLYVADGYGANYISVADTGTRRWKGIFGGNSENALENGKFATAHGINQHYEVHRQLVIADRPSSRIQVHDLEGAFIASYLLPAGAWPCGIDFLNWKGRWLAVIGSLVDPVENRPAPIYIVDADTYQVLSTIRPKEDLGLEKVQHLHNVVWHVFQDRLFLVCQSWNPGNYFVLEQA